MTRRRVMIWGGLAAAIAIAILAVTHESTQSVTLPDGSRLKLLKTGYGRVLHYRVNGTALDKALYSWVPDSWLDAARLPPGTNVIPFRAKIGSVALKHVSSFYTMSTNALGLWLEHTTPNTNLAPSFRLAPVDEGGAGLTHAQYRILSPNYVMSRLIGIEVPAFPRRADTVRLRVYAQSNDVWVTAGEFTVRNPDRQRVASWPATPLPATLNVEGDPVTLQHFWSGVDGTPPRLVPEAQQGVTMLQLLFGGSTERRMPGSTESARVTDATGNVWYQVAFSTQRRENTETVSFTARLPTNETLKIEITLSRQRNFRPDQLWEVRDVPLPLPDQYTTVTNVTATRDGVTIQFLGVSAPNVKFPGANSWGSSPSAHFNITPALSRAARSWRLSVVDLLDESGKSVGSGPFVMRLGPNNPSTPIRYPAKLSRAKFVFALHQPTNATFFVRVQNPPVPP